MAKTPKMSPYLVSRVWGDGSTQRKVGIPNMSTKAHFRVGVHGGGPREGGSDIY